MATTPAATTLFVIPGFKEKIEDKQYRQLKKLFVQKGFSVKMVPITWSYRCLSDWVLEFEDFFAQHKGEKNYVLGFSYGAMIALLAAKHVRPNKLFLCSLSPYFQEDIAKIPSRWKSFIGKKRTQDFKNFSFAQAVDGLRVKTIVFLGSAEANKFSLLKARCEAAATLLPNAKLVVIKGASHDIGNTHYQQALTLHVSL